MHKKKNLNWQPFMHRVYGMEKNKFQFRQPLGDIRTTLLYQFIWPNVFNVCNIMCPEIFWLCQYGIYFHRSLSPNLYSYIFIRLGEKTLRVNSVLINTINTRPIVRLESCPAKSHDLVALITVITKDRKEESDSWDQKLSAQYNPTFFRTNKTICSYRLNAVICCIF